MEVESDTKKRRRAEIILFGMAVIWGGTFPIVKHGLSDVSPLLFISIRFWAATVLLCVLFRKNLFTASIATIGRGIFLGVLLTIGFWGQTVGLTMTTASKCAFITGTSVIFTPLVQLILERRPPSAGNIAGIILVTVGLWIFTSPEGAEMNRGDWLTLFAAVVWGVYIVCIDLYSKGHDSRQLTFFQIAANAVLMTALMPFLETPFIRPTAGVIGALAYTAILSTMLTTLMQTRYQKDSTPTRAAIIFSIEPVVAAVLAYYFIGENIGALGVLGGVLIVLGLLVSELSDSLTALLSKIAGLAKRENT